jgi:homoserine kinase
MAAGNTRWTVGTSVQVRAPGSSANIGPGFDSIGLALGLWDDYTATVTESGLQILVDGEAAFSLPRDERHLVYATMLRTWGRLGVQPPRGLELVCRNGIPQSRGLGSSATAIVAGVLAAQGLLALATTGSVDVDRVVTNAISSGFEGHPDNASATNYGGMTLSWYDEPGAAGPVANGDASLHTIRLEVSDLVVPLVFLPTRTLATVTAREVLPAQVPHAEAALNAARAALLVEAMARRPDLLLPATRDWLHQEQRRLWFPESMAVVDSLRSAGHAAVISGAGPSILVLTTAGRRSAVEALVGAAEWRTLDPGIPDIGATVVGTESTR